MKKFILIALLAAAALYFFMWRKPSSAKTKPQGAGATEPGTAEEPTYPSGSGIGVIAAEPQVNVGVADQTQGGGLTSFPIISNQFSLPIIGSTTVPAFGTGNLIAPMLTNIGVNSGSMLKAKPTLANTLDMAPVPNTTVGVSVNPQVTQGFDFNAIQTR